MSARRIRRRIISGTMTGLVAALSAVAVLALVLILGHLVAKGASSLDWNFFVKSPVPAGQTGGGVANAIVGTVLIVSLAALIGLPVGVGKIGRASCRERGRIRVVSIRSRRGCITSLF